ncbi:hypothetical protein ACIQSP_16315 [Streptomyces nigra]|uniref:hypothetical protein n=1 Tax=Streptomyces nigra TaxID=1827580 RepID=UPI0037F4BA7C
MSASNTVSPARVDRSVSIARLHGRACWQCGAVAKDLKPAGTVKVGDDDREWTIVTCGDHSTAVTP